MKSRITIDFKGVDKMPSGNQFEPVIRVNIEDSEDVRDGLVKAFFEALGGESNWLRVDFQSNTDYGRKSTNVTISPIRPDELAELSDRLHCRYSTVTKTSSEGLPSRFQIGDKADFTTQEWVEEAFEKAKKLTPLISDDDLDYIPHYGFGTIVAIKFTEAKVWYDVLDDYTGKVIEEIDSSYMKSFSEQVRQEISVSQGSSGATVNLEPSITLGKTTLTEEDFKNIKNK